MRVTHGTFVECAMSGVSGFTKVGVYYFYQRCEENIDNDGYFQPFLDILSMRGDTVSLLDNDDKAEDTIATQSSSLSKRAKKDAGATSLLCDAMLQNLIQQGGTLLQHLADAAEDRKAAAEERKSAASDRKRKLKFHARLEVAKALGDKDEVIKLMAEAKSMDDNSE